MEATPISEVYDELANHARTLQGLDLQATAVIVAEWRRILDRGATGTTDYRSFVYGIIVAVNRIQALMIGLGLDPGAVRRLLSPMAVACGEAARQITDTGEIADVSDDLFTDVALQCELNVYKQAGHA